MLNNVISWCFWRASCETAPAKGPHHLCIKTKTLWDFMCVQGASIPCLAAHANDLVCAQICLVVGIFLFLSWSLKCKESPRSLLLVILGLCFW